MRLAFNENIMKLEAVEEKYRETERIVNSREHREYEREIEEATRDYLSILRELAGDRAMALAKEAIAKYIQFYNKVKNLSVKPEKALILSLLYHKLWHELQESATVKRWGDLTGKRDKPDEASEIYGKGLKLAMGYFGIKKLEKIENLNPVLERCEQKYGSLAGVKNEETAEFLRKAYRYVN